MPAEHMLTIPTDLPFVQCRKDLDIIYPTQCMIRALFIERTLVILRIYTLPDKIVK
jgi:hypothetical protein